MIMRYFSLSVVMLAAALLVASCSNKVSQKDVKKAEAALFNADKTTNEDAVANAISTFSAFAEDNPDDASAPEYLFKALEVSVNTHQEPQASIDLMERLVTNYPDFDKNPVAMFMVATFIYDEQLGDLEKARATYQRIIDKYPNNAFARDAAIAIEQLGISPDDLVKMFEAQDTIGQ